MTVTWAARKTPATISSLTIRPCHHSPLGPLHPSPSLSHTSSSEVLLRLKSSFSDLYRERCCPLELRWSCAVTLSRPSSTDHASSRAHQKMDSATYRSGAFMAATTLRRAPTSQEEKELEDILERRL